MRHNGSAVQPLEKTSGQKIAGFFRQPQLVLMTLAGLALVVGVPYFAFRYVLPNAVNPITGEASAPEGDQNAGIDFESLSTLPEEFAQAAGVILQQQEPVMPEPLMELEEPNGIGLIHPVTEVVEGEQPGLSWHAFAQGPYEVAVLDVLNTVVANVRNFPGTSWAVPKKLTRGARYHWRVTAANGEIQTAAFVVLNGEHLTALQQIRRENKDSHLALGLTAEYLGMLTVAEREYTELMRQFPNAEAPARLLDNVLGLRE
jgi:hypothetical protein